MYKKGLCHDKICLIISFLHQFSLVTQSCLTLCNPMDCSTPGLPLHYQLPPRVGSNSCPSSRWCHPTISPSVAPFSSHLQSFPASGSFLVSQLSASDGQSIGASASESILAMNIQDWFPVLDGSMLIAQLDFGRICKWNIPPLLHLALLSSPSPHTKTKNATWNTSSKECRVTPALGVPRTGDFQA